MTRAHKRPWTEQECERLRAMKSTGMLSREMAAELGRTTYAVEAKFKELGLCHSRAKVGPRSVPHDLEPSAPDTAWDRLATKSLGREIGSPRPLRRGEVLQKITPTNKLPPGFGSLQPLETRS